MASFLQSIVKRFSGAKAPKPPQLHLGAFGKHPGWNDHIDDLGLQTEQLINAKRILYVQGIAGNIDSGFWDKLGEDQQIKTFHHVFLWRSLEDIIVGRLWSSSDGKGRTKYPMIVCAHTSSLSLSWVLQNVLPQLERIELACTRTNDANAVRSIVDSAREDLRRMAQLPEALVEPPGQTHPITVLAKRPEMGRRAESNHEHAGLLRVQYQVEREPAAFRPDHRGDRGSRVISIAPKHLRVPPCAETPAGVLLLWTRFLLSQLDPASPTLVLYPIEHPWCDLIVGEPSVSQLQCLRAAPRQTALNTDIPYNLDPEFIERASRLIASAR